MHAHLSMLLAVAFAHPLGASLLAVALSVGAVVGMATTVNAATGTGYLGSLPIATNTVPFLLNPAPDGVIDTIVWTLSFQLQATAGMGPLVVGGLPMGQDDMDVLTQAMILAISAKLDTSSYLFQSITMPQLRKTVQALIRRDFGGNFRNGGTVPSGSYGKFTIQIPIPLATPQRFTDGAIMGQGATRVRQGEIDVTVLALSGTGVVLTNYVVEFQSVSSQFSAVGHAGDNSQVGTSWAVEFATWGQNNLTRPPRARILFALQQASSTSATLYGDTGITVAGQNTVDLTGANETQLDYQNRILQDGGYDLTDGLTVLCALDPSATVATLPSPQALTLKIPLATTMPFMDLYLADAPTAVVATSAAGAAGSASSPVAEGAPSLPSLQPGTSISPSAARYVPQTFKPPAQAPAGSTQHATPQGAAVRTNTRQSLLKSAINRK